MIPAEWTITFQPISTKQIESDSKQILEDISFHVFDSFPTQKTAEVQPKKIPYSVWNFDSTLS